MATVETKNKIVRWPITKLKPHPLNKTFDNLPDAQLQSLAEDMKRNGQEHPIDVLPNGVVIGGHQRLRAAKLLGWKDIKCRIRYDLGAAGDEAIYAFLIRDNLFRRQLDELAMARAYRELKKVMQSRGRNGEIRGDVRDFIAKQFNKSGRTLDRWAALLDGPQEILNAVVAKKLKFVDACKAINLPTDVLAEIAEEIRMGQPAQQAITNRVGKNGAAPVNIGGLFRRLVRDVEQHTAAMKGRVDEIDWVFSLRHAGTLRQGRKLLDRVIARLETIAAESEAQGGLVGELADDLRESESDEE